MNLITPREISQYKSEGYALEKGKDLKPKGSRNAATGGDASFSMQFGFNGFARQGVIAGTEYEKYFESKFEKNVFWRRTDSTASELVLGSGL